MTGRADHALAYSSLLWPDFVAFEGYILRDPVDVTRLRGWESASLNRQEIETLMNFEPMDWIFQVDPTPAKLKEAQLTRLAEIMADILLAKLRRDFPDRLFLAFVINNTEDFGVSFHQA
jgi:hypothetical protein